MHERFNFYDVYAYLFPGLTAIGLFAAPVLVALGEIPNAELSATLAVVLAGYAVGHVLAEVGRCLPYLRERPLPHIRLVEPVGGLTAELRGAVVQGLRERLGLELDRATDTQKQDAFDFARNYVIQEGAPGYFEQFQGLYGLMRGLSAATGLAAVAYATWGIAGILAFEPDLSRIAFAITMLSSAIALLGALIARVVQRSTRTDRTKRWWNGARNWLFASVIACASAAYGWLAATKALPTREHGGAFLAAAFVLAVLSERFSRLFKEQATNFAKAVYLAFAAACIGSEAPPGRAPPASTP